MAHVVEEGGFPVGEAPESVFRSVAEAEVSLDEMLSLACRQGKQDIVELLLESGANVNHRNKAGNTPLLEACSQGHVSIARLLLDRHANIDTPTETTHDSALTWACTLGNEEIVELLLHRNARVEHRTKDGCTALMFAALAGHERVAKLLLDHGAEINVESDSNKDSPLTFACWKGHQKVVKLFLERNADIEHRTKEGFSPLMFAALGGHTEVAELLLKHGAQVNTPSGSNNDIPLTSACWKGHHHVVYLLLQYSSNIEHRTKDGCTPLMLAAREGHLSVARLLLEHGAKVNVPSGSENNIPLTLACWKGHRDVVNLLLRHSSSIEHQNKAGCTPLMLAAREGHSEATQLLLGSGAQLNIPSGSNDDTPLTLACWKGHETVVRLLVDKNSNVNHQTKTGCTPLMEATREGHVGVARLLLEAGADVETPDNYGQSPFFMACWKGHADVAALLLEYEANKDCRTKTGITPLFQACRENHVDVVKLLLDYGCNPSTPFPNSRECPLTLAAEKGFADLAQLLLSRNANIECRTKKGCTPFFLACREGFKEIAVMLAKHGADTEATDHRGTTPLLAAFRSGHVELVEWLLGHVAHLPSDIDCQRALMAPMPTHSDILPQRSKCLEMIMKAKKAREQAALRNAQSLFEELDAEKEKQESKKKAAAKKRSKRKERKRKEQAEKTEATQEEAGDTENQDQLPTREEPDGESSLTPPPPTHLTDEVPRASNEDAEGPCGPQKKKRFKKKKKKKGGTDEATPTPSIAITTREESNDSADDEFHDAQSELPDFNPPDPVPQRHSPVSPPMTVSPTTRLTSMTKEEKTSISTTSTVGKMREERHQHLKTEGTETTARHTERAEETKPEEKHRSARTRKEEWEKPVKQERQERQAQKNHKGKPKVTKSISAPSETRKIEVLPTEPKAYAVHQSLTISRPQHPNSGAKQNTSKLEQSSKINTSAIRRQPEKTALPHQHLKPTANRQPEEEGWVRAVSRHSSTKDRSTSTSPVPPGHVTLRNNPIRPSSQPSDQSYASKVKQEGVWTLSQESASDWGSEEMDLEELQVISCCSTDDEKIRSQKLRSAVAPLSTSSSGGPISRPMATAASPTPTGTISTAPPPPPHPSQPWQEVSRATRTAQLTVSNTLVGRIIGRGGAKINSIQETSGAHIAISRNIPKSTERLITIKGTYRAVTKAQELIEEALNTPDHDIDIIIPSPPPMSHPLPSSSSSLYPRTISPEGNKVDTPTPLPTRLKKRHPDIVQPSPLQLKAIPPSAAVAPQQSHNQLPSSNPHLPYSSRRISLPIPTTITEHTSYDISDPTSAIGCTKFDFSPEMPLIVSGSIQKDNVWQAPTESLTSSVSLSLTSQTVGSSERTFSQEEEDLDLSIATSSLSASLAALPLDDSDLSLDDQDPVKPVRPVQAPLTPDPVKSTVEEDTQRKLRHSRSMSDPQVLVDQAEGLVGGRKGQQLTLPCLSHYFSPSMPTINSPSAVTSDFPTPLSLEKLAVGSRRPEKAKKAETSRDVVTSQAAVASAQALREQSRATKTTRSVAVIQPTQQQQQHRVSLPASSFPVSTQAASTSDFPTSGAHGAIGSRRSSVPVPTGALGVTQPQRKFGHAGLLWIQGQLRPVSYLPEGGARFDLNAPPPSQPAAAWKNSQANPGSPLHPEWLPSISEGDRTRSFSWAGQPGLGGYFGPRGVPPFQPQPVYLVKPQSEDHAFQPQTPDTPHGETLHEELWAKSDFPPPGSVYGPIGSNTPSSAANLQGSQWFAAPDPVKSTIHTSEAWSHPFPGKVPPQNPYLHQQYPHHHHHVAATRPFGGAPDPTYLQRSVGQGHKFPGQDVGFDNPGLMAPPPPPMGYEEDPSIPVHKRWPAHNAVYQPQLPFQPTGVPHHPDLHSWSSSYVHGRHSVAEPEPRKVHSGSFPLTSSDSWSYWGTGSNFPSSGRLDLPRVQEKRVPSPRYSRSLSVGFAEPWSTTAALPETSSELQQLMKSLDIAEHIHVLKDRKLLSVQQLQSMSEEEWRGLRLPVGPRVKLMNAVSNMARSGGKQSGECSSEPVSLGQGFAASVTSTSQADELFMQGPFQ